MDYLLTAAVLAFVGGTAALAIGKPADYLRLFEPLFALFVGLTALSLAGAVGYSAGVREGVGYIEDELQRLRAIVGLEFSVPVRALAAFGGGSLYLRALKIVAQVARRRPLQALTGNGDDHPDNAGDRDG